MKTEEPTLSEAIDFCKLGAKKIRGIDGKDLTEKTAKMVDLVIEAAENSIELQQLFDLQWNADQRAIKIWQEAAGNHDTWPDRCDMVVFLMKNIDKEAE